MTQRVALVDQLYQPPRRAQDQTVVLKAILPFQIRQPLVQLALQTAAPLLFPLPLVSVSQLISQLHSAVVCLHKIRWYSAIRIIKVDSRFPCSVKVIVQNPAHLAAVFLHEPDQWPVQRSVNLQQLLHTAVSAEVPVAVHHLPCFFQRDLHAVFVSKLNQLQHIKVNVCALAFQLCVSVRRQLQYIAHPLALRVNCALRQCIYAVLRHVHESGLGHVFNPRSASNRRNPFASVCRHISSVR